MDVPLTLSQVRGTSEYLPHILWGGRGVRTGGQSETRERKEDRGAVDMVRALLSCAMVRRGLHVHGHQT